MAFDRKVAQYARVKKKGGSGMVRKLVSYTPYKCFVIGKPPKKLFLRGGNFYWADGKQAEASEIPAEIIQTVKTMTAEGKKQYGVPKGA